MKKKSIQDRHASGFLVRLPLSLRIPLEDLKKRYRRPTTVEVQIALEKHFASEGIRVRPA